jgi:hypothetical protein
VEHIGAPRRGCKQVDAESVRGYRKRRKGTSDIQVGAVRLLLLLLWLLSNLMDQYPNIPRIMRDYAVLLRDIYREDEMANTLIKVADAIEGVRYY